MVTHIEPINKVSDKLREMLNEAIGKEIAVSILYMWQHVQVIEVKGGPFRSNSNRRPLQR